MPGRSVRTVVTLRRFGPSGLDGAWRYRSQVAALGSPGREILGRQQPDQRRDGRVARTNRGDRLADRLSNGRGRSLANPGAPGCFGGRDAQRGDRVRDRRGIRYPGHGQIGGDGGIAATVADAEQSGLG